MVCGQALPHETRLKWGGTMPPFLFNQNYEIMRKFRCDYHYVDELIRRYEEAGGQVICLNDGCIARGKGKNVRAIPFSEPSAKHPGSTGIISRYHLDVTKASHQSSTDIATRCQDTSFL